MVVNGHMRNTKIETCIGKGNRRKEIWKERRRKRRKNEKL